MKVLIINGPNLNLLGTREPGIYGTGTYADLERMVMAEAGAHAKSPEVTFAQSNSEGALIDFIQGATGVYDGIIINPAAYTHYSYAIYDALLASPLPAIEVHISNIHTRDEFRKHSVTAKACVGQITGLGFYGYIAALNYLVTHHG